MDAYETIQDLAPGSLIDKISFDKLVIGFRKGYLEEKNYASRLAAHRKPAEFNNEILQCLYTDIRLIQQRKELQHIATEKKAYTHVHIMVADIFQADKKIKSLYEAVTVYCNQYNRDLTATAVHLAEYRALSKLCVILRGKTNKLLTAALPRPPYGNVHFIDAAPVIKGWEDIKAGRSFVAPIEPKYFRCEQTETTPPPGIQLHPLYPNCCEPHKTLFSRGLDIFNRFPDCCTAHRKLKAAPWFRKEDYQYLPVKFVNAVTYTWECIKENIEDTGWYKKITDYMAYTHNSFGQLPEGYGSPLGVSQYLDYIIHNIKISALVAPEKKDALLLFIEQHFYSKEARQATDVNLLIGEYKKWLKIFPFGISFFKDYKILLGDRMPIFSGPGETNIYTGLTAFKLKTRRELFQYLVDLTKGLLEHINSAEHYKTGVLEDPTAVAIEIVLAKRKLALDTQLNTECVERSQYIKLLKKWLNDEKIFLRELAQLLKRKAKTCLSATLCRL